MSYRFPVVRKGKQIETPDVIMPEREPAEVIGTIQGRTPGSKEEWWVALALWRLKHVFIYQYQVFGGYGIRGGLIVDFLVVTTVPRSTFIQVFGEYWHSGELGSEDSFNLARLRHEHSNQSDILVLWGKDLPDKEAAYQKLRREIGVA